jgi:hypothetical protein
MDIMVYNDGKEVFNGSLVQFLNDNDSEEWLTEECSRLETTDRIEFSEFSGDWVIIKQ